SANAALFQSGHGRATAAPPSAPPVSFATALLPRATAPADDCTARRVARHGMIRPDAPLHVNPAPEEATVSGHPPRQIPRTSRAETVALELIVFFKAVKSATLFIIGLGLLALIGRDIGAIAQTVAEALNIDVHRDF